jgi:hypothetical protein
MAENLRIEQCLDKRKETAVCKTWIIYWCKDEPCTENPDDINRNQSYT